MERSAGRFINETHADIQDLGRNPIHGYEDEPLSSLEEAAKTLVSFIPQIAQDVSTAKHNCNQNSHLLTLDESAAIYLYTMPGPVFRLLNQALRSEDRHSIKPWFSFLKLFITALKKLPSSTITVWRGAAIDDGVIFTDGDIHTWWTVNSCSNDLAVIQIYLGKTGTVFAIDAAEAKNISSFSTFPDEKELILMPGTRVRPYCRHLNFNDQYFLIHLKEESQQRLVWKSLIS
ncbi:unnamed protein product [Rotaria sp. Silwood2]|nr:unnamed protein product [Rotaria sp. Silwood2]CAF3020066.1 unnamed protein product [Rotaria sp. Silwood2]CAF3284256.1 unnamed protein product [Rotaria sp. Silwood2]CAF4170315.1 unnamed protein product [Rotaria sp. Silwood2]CAF4282711.1 unnamed protein product [Rotaria sp. Silwood2]